MLQRDDNRARLGLTQAQFRAIALQLGIPEMTLLAYVLQQHGADQEETAGIEPTTGLPSLLTPAAIAPPSDPTRPILFKGPKGFV